MVLDPFDTEVEEEIFVPLEEDTFINTIVDDTTGEKVVVEETPYSILNGDLILGIFIGYIITMTMMGGF